MVFGVRLDKYDEAGTRVSRNCHSSWSGLPFGLTQGQISQIWPFLIALGLEIFGLAFGSFLAFWGEFGIKDFCLALMSIFGFFWPFLHEATIEVRQCAPTPIFRYHTLTVWLYKDVQTFVDYEICCHSLMQFCANCKLYKRKSREKLQRRLCATNGKFGLFEAIWP